jgi:hypothetical protein
VQAQAAAQPPWLSTYLRGASMEMYLLVAFPSALWGLTYTQAARFIYDNCQQAVLLSVTLPGSDNPLVMPTHLVGKLKRTRAGLDIMVLLGVLDNLFSVLTCIRVAGGLVYVPGCTQVNDVICLVGCAWIFQDDQMCRHPTLFHRVNAIGICLFSPAAYLSQDYNMPVHAACYRSLARAWAPT